ncbi:MAG TPA: hypothetical protein VD969_29170 [Symbiobacteriaceae bacterium]|nr:hypothetical protein [Symbiobacteriaceae bacterium]
MNVADAGSVSISSSPKLYNTIATVEQADRTVQKSPAVAASPATAPAGTPAPSAAANRATTMADTGAVRFPGAPGRDVVIAPFVPPSREEKLVAIAEGVGDAVKDIARGLWGLAKELVTTTDTDRMNKSMYAAATGNGPGAVLLNIVEGVVHDAAETAKLGYKALTDPMVTTGDLRQLGKVGTNTAINAATIYSGGNALTAAADAASLGAVSYSTEVAVKATTRSVTVKTTAEAAKVVVMGEGAEQIAAQVASPAGRELMRSLPSSGEAIGAARSVSAGAVGEQMASEVSKVLGATERLPTKLPNGNGIDLAARNPATGDIIATEAKATSKVTTDVKLTVNQRTPGPQTIQGTPSYNGSYASVYSFSSTPELQSTGVAMRSAGQQSLIVQTNGAGQLTIANGKTVEAAAVSGGTAVGGGVAKSGVIAPTLTTGEKAAVSAATATGTATAVKSSPSPKKVRTHVSSDAPTSSSAAAPATSPPKPTSAPVAPSASESKPATPAPAVAASKPSTPPPVTRATGTLTSPAVGRVSMW